MARSASQTMPEWPPLIRALCNPALHGGSAIQVLETHISWVLLAGNWAYKIKKPVDFGFLNFSTLALRQKYCLEELRLNQRLAPQLYVGVVAITGELGKLEFDGPGSVLEYAVKLQRFDEAALADRLLAEGRLTAALIDGLAEDLAAFHERADHSSLEDPHGLPTTILAAAEHNFDHLLRVFPEHRLRWQALWAWTESTFAKLREAFLMRKALGLVRECHGDLHCGNLVLLGERLVAFDCIEFSEDLRWIDCMSEIAFVFMDLQAHGRSDLAWRLLNGYLQISGDYSGLEVLNFYRVYRALVRAKIAALSLEQSNDAHEAERLRVRVQDYLQWAEQAAQPKTACLLMTHGLSGSGKSHLARALAERLPAIRIVSDIERKRLAGLAPLAKSGSESSGGIYKAFFTRQTYGVLLKLAEQALQAGFHVVLDATYLRAEQRLPCQQLAERLGLRFCILSMQAPEAILCERIAARLAEGCDPSEADQKVLAVQMGVLEAMEAAELPFVMAVDASGDVDVDSVLRALGEAGCLP